MLTVIQARMSSHRLPGKALMQVGGKTILERVINRVQLADVGRVVVATSTDQSDDPIQILCARRKVECYRGPLDDVLARIYQTAVEYNGDPIVRVTADCPLLCPALLADLAAAFTPTTHYAVTTNAPEGLVAEIVSMEALTETHQDARSRRDREHVVTYILDRQNWFDCLTVDAGLDQTELRFSIDTQADLDRLAAMHKANRKLFSLTGKQLVARELAYV